MGRSKPAALGRLERSTQSAAVRSAREVLPQWRREFSGGSGADRAGRHALQQFRLATLCVGEVPEDHYRLWASAAADGALDARGGRGRMGDGRDREASWRNAADVAR